MEGWAALITAILVGGGSFTGSVIGLVKQVKRGDPQARARIRRLERDLLTAEAVIFRLKTILVRHGLMTQYELENGDAEPDAGSVTDRPSTDGDPDDDPDADEDDAA